jgi:hypothetical protein
VNQEGRRGAGQHGHPVDHEVEDVLRGAALQQGGPNVGDRGEPNAANLRGLVQPCVGDCDAGSPGECGEVGVVLGAEERLPLRGEVEVSEGLTAAGHRHAQEADGLRVHRPQRPRLGSRLGIGTDVDEGHHHPAVVQQSQRSVLRIDQRDGGLDDVAQRHVQIQTGGQVEKRFEQPLHAVLPACHGVPPVVAFVHHLGQSHLPRGVRRLRGRRGVVLLRVFRHSHSPAVEAPQGLCQPSGGQHGAPFFTARTGREVLHSEDGPRS